MLKKIVNLLKAKYYHFIAPKRFLQMQKNVQFPIIMSIHETLDILVNTNMSIARFGDGELNMLDNYDVGFQRYNSILSKRLREVLTVENNKCLIALPEPLSNIESQNFQAQKIWKYSIVRYYKKYYKLLNFESCYANSFISRPYMDYIDKAHVEEFYNKFREVWKNKNILIVEGKNTKLGIGNDLLNSAKSIRRILTVDKNAFDIYKKIYDSIIKHSKGIDIVILALGPTATVLAYDLSGLGIRALDLGHIDIEYEWFKLKVETKVIIKGKNVNEVNHFIEDDINFSSYEEEVVETIF